MAMGGRNPGDDRLRIVLPRSVARKKGEWFKASHAPTKALPSRKAQTGGLDPKSEVMVALFPDYRQTLVGLTVICRESWGLETLS